MDQTVPRGSDFSPFNLRMVYLELIGNEPSCFPDYLLEADQRQRQHFVTV